MPKKTLVAIPIGPTPKVDPEAVPKHVYDSMARTLYPALVKYFEIPENMADFEAWLPGYRARQAAMEAEARP